MGSVFNAAEIVDMGIEKENKRRDFYALVAENFDQSEVKDLFTKLRDWEETHVKKFTEIRDSVKGHEVRESREGEMKEYMDNVVDDRLYSDITPEGFSEKIKTPLEAIERGMEFEKDAILFFSELLPHMESSNRDAVQKLINEEKQHLVYLSELKEKY